MKIIVDGIIFQTQKVGGVSRIYHEILPRMCEMDRNLTVDLLIDGHPLQDLPRHERIHISQCLPIYSYLRPRRLWDPVIPALRRFLQKNILMKNTDAIWHSTFFTLPGSWKGKQIVTVYDLIHEKFAHLFSAKEDDQFRREKTECINKADMVITISETTRQDVHKHYGKPLEAIVPIHLACGLIFKQLKAEEKIKALGLTKPFILYVGGRVHYKNFDILGRAFSRWSMRESYQLALVGGGLTETEKTRLRELNILEHVVVLNAVDDDMLCQLYNQTAFFVYPSLYEGFGIPLLEAMQCGCLIVASSIPTTQEIAGDVPIYFDPDSESSLVHAMERAIKEKKIDRIENGLKQAALFSWDKTARETLSVYQNLK
jgi:glycosyltransferase involved in cell wall biosynthesis